MRKASLEVGGVEAAPTTNARDRAETRDRYRGRRCVKGSVGAAEPGDRSLQQSRWGLVPCGRRRGPLRGVTRASTGPEVRVAAAVDVLWPLAPSLDQACQPTHRPASESPEGCGVQQPKPGPPADRPRVACPCHRRRRPARHHSRCWRGDGDLRNRAGGSAGCSARTCSSRPRSARQARSPRPSGASTVCSGSRTWPRRVQKPVHAARRWYSPSSPPRRSRRCTRP
jgi:hypothetical protein